MHGRIRTPTLIVTGMLAALGCAGAPPEPAAEEQSEPAETQFDAGSAGVIRGRINWPGELPLVPPFRLSFSPLVSPLGGEPPSRPNPNAPAVDPRTRGVGGAVVFLRGVDARRARPWNHAPVRVVQQEEQFRICQGQETSTVGFVRRGETVVMVSRDATFYALHASGASFFTLTFPDPDQPRARRLAEKGLVELTSEAGYYWMRAYLFVDDHPYYVRTDAGGHFELRDVPSGDYEVVCWLPDWRVLRHERDPESSLVRRVFFRPPIETVRRVTLGPGEARELDFEVSPPP